VVGTPFTLTDSTGAPLADTLVHVRLLGSNGWNNLGHTDDAGSLAADLAPGTYEVRANVHGMQIINLVDITGPGAVSVQYAG
jgi:hypothetical protein